MESGRFDAGSPVTADGPWQTVLLVGFMASGKTSVAALLSDRLGWPVRDVDRLLEEEEGLTVREIFETRGEPWFREREAALTRRLLGERRVVLAPGGGWAAAPGRLDELPEHVLSVWLRVGAEEAIRRAGDAPGSRPLLATGGPGDAKALAAVSDLLRERERWYRRAALHLDTSRATPLEVADSILNHMARRQDADGRIQ